MADRTTSPMEETTFEAQWKHGSLSSFIPVRRQVPTRPTAQEIEGGRRTAQDLRAKAVSGILVQAADAGFITSLSCEMTFCFCPKGRATFDDLGLALGPWMPTHEHFPLAKRSKGIRSLENTILAHRRCNNIGYKLEALLEHLQGFEVDGVPLEPQAIHVAMEDHIRLRFDNSGRYPFRRGAWKRAKKAAINTHERLRVASR